MEHKDQLPWPFRVLLDLAGEEQATHSHAKSIAQEVLSWLIIGHCMSVEEALQQILASRSDHLSTSRITTSAYTSLTSHQSVKVGASVPSIVTNLGRLQQDVGLLNQLAPENALLNFILLRHAMSRAGRITEQAIDQTCLSMMIYMHCGIETAVREI